MSYKQERGSMKVRINPKNGQELSILGYGCMRFPTVNGSIDEPLAKEQLLYAIDNGVNYLDTAYIYHNGKSEGFLGKVIKEENLRDKVYIATKLPVFLVRSAKDIDKFFEKQKQRLETNRIDYYLMHMLSDLDTWEKLCGFGIEEWITKKKESGEIGSIGFSFHGGREQFKQILKAYEWEFVQIQYNYLDENNQAGKSGLELAAERGIPVMIMEPLRGGKLVNALPLELEKLWANTGKTPAQQALSWVWNHKEVTLLLSGMSTLPQVKENIALASVAEPNMISQEEQSYFQKAREILHENIKVPCTGCGYCMPCPAHVDIPTCFSAYNEAFSMRNRRFSYMQATGAMSKTPANASCCVRCGRCEEHCPQGILIREKLQEVVKHMEKFPFKIIRGIARKIM